MGCGRGFRGVFVINVHTCGMYCQAFTANAGIAQLGAIAKVQRLAMYICERVQVSGVETAQVSKSLLTAT